MATTLAERMNHFSGSPTSALIATVAELKRQGKNIISLNVGEPDFGTPDYIKVAGIKAIYQVYPWQRHSGAAAGDCQKAERRQRGGVCPQ